MSYVFAGILDGLLCGVIAFFVLWVVFGWINALYHKIKDGSLSSDDDTACKVAVIGAAIVITFWIVMGTWMQLEDKWVDFYNDEGQIVETYQITDYDKSWFGDGVTFYLKDGRTMVKQDCVYNIRFEGEEIK